MLYTQTHTCSHSNISLTATPSFCPSTLTRCTCNSEQPCTQIYRGAEENHSHIHTWHGGPTDTEPWAWQPAEDKTRGLPNMKLHTAGTPNCSRKVISLIPVLGHAPIHTSARRPTQFPYTLHGSFVAIVKQGSCLKSAKPCQTLLLCYSTKKDCDVQGKLSTKHQHLFLKKRHSHAMCLLRVYLKESLIYFLQKLLVILYTTRCIYMYIK